MQRLYRGNVPSGVVPPAHVCVSTPVKTFCKTSPACLGRGGRSRRGGKRRPCARRAPLDGPGRTSVRHPPSPESSWKSKKSGSIARHNLRAELTLSRKAGIPRERGVLAETVDAFALRSMPSIAISSEEKPAMGGVVVVGVRRHTLFSQSITFPSDTRVNVSPPSARRVALRLPLIKWSGPASDAVGHSVIGGCTNDEITANAEIGASTHESASRSPSQNRLIERVASAAKRRCCASTTDVHRSTGG